MNLRPDLDHTNSLASLGALVDHALMSLERAEKIEKEQESKISIEKLFPISEKTEVKNHLESKVNMETLEERETVLIDKNGIDADESSSDRASQSGERNLTDYGFAAESVKRETDSFATESFMEVEQTLLTWILAANKKGGDRNRLLRKLNDLKDELNAKQDEAENANKKKLEFKKNKDRKKKEKMFLSFAPTEKINKRKEKASSKKTKKKSKKKKNKKKKAKLTKQKDEGKTNKIVNSEKKLEDMLAELQKQICDTKNKNTSKKSIPPKKATNNHKPEKPEKPERTTDIKSDKSKTKNVTNLFAKIDKKKKKKKENTLSEIKAEKYKAPKQLSFCNISKSFYPKSKPLDEKRGVSKDDKKVEKRKIEIFRDLPFRKKTEDKNTVTKDKVSLQKINKKKEEKKYRRITEDKQKDKKIKEDDYTLSFSPKNLNLADATAVDKNKINFHNKDKNSSKSIKALLIVALVTAIIFIILGFLKYNESKRLEKIILKTDIASYAE